MSEKIKTKKESSITPPAVDILLCLTALLVTSVYYYGYRALVVTSMSIITCYVTDLLCIFLRKQKYVFKNISPIIIGFTLSMLMPASVTYSVLVATCVITIVIGKQVFGGIDNPIFAPVAVGYAISSICWKAGMLLYTVPEPLSKLPFASHIANIDTHSLTYFINQGTIPFVSRYEIFLGRFAGPMGATHLAILAVCAVVLMLRKIIPWQTVLTTIATLVVGALAIPTNNIASNFDLILFELATGASLFILIFIACDINLVPKTPTGKVLYGLFIGLFTIVFRKYALVEQGMIFAVIIADVLIDVFDSAHKVTLAIAKQIKTWPRKVSVFIAHVSVFTAKQIARLFKFVWNKIFNGKSESQPLPDADTSSQPDNDIISEEKLLKKDKKIKNKKVQENQVTDNTPEIVSDIEKPVEEAPTTVTPLVPASLKNSKENKLKDKRTKEKPVADNTPETVPDIEKPAEEVSLPVVPENAAPQKKSKEKKVKEKKEKKNKPFTFDKQKTEVEIKISEPVTVVKTVHESEARSYVQYTAASGTRTRTRHEAPKATAVITEERPASVTPSQTVSRSPRRRESEINQQSSHKAGEQIGLFDMNGNTEDLRNRHSTTKVVEKSSTDSRKEFEVILENQPRRRRHNPADSAINTKQNYANTDNLNDILDNQPSRKAIEKNNDSMATKADKED